MTVHVTIIYHMRNVWLQIVDLATISLNTGRVKLHCYYLSNYLVNPLSKIICNRSLYSILVVIILWLNIFIKHRWNKITVGKMEICVRLKGQIKITGFEKQFSSWCGWEEKKGKDFFKSVFVVIICLVWMWWNKRQQH